MSEVEETVVDQGIATPEAEAQAPQQDVEAHEEQVMTQEVQEDPQDRNWRQMRKRIEELEQNNTYLMSENRTLKQPKQEAPSLPDWANVDGEDLLTKNQTMSVAEKVAAEAVKKALKEQEYSQAPKLIEEQYSDYSQVVTPENVERLKQTNPRLAASLGGLEDPYAQGALAYTYIKSSGIYKGESDVSTRQKALANMQKPMPAQAAKSSNALENANAYANGLTPDLKQKLWSEMQAAIRKG